MILATPLRTVPRPPRTVARAFVLALAFAAGLAAFANADPLKDGKDALAQGRVDDAVTAYRQAVAEMPNDAQAHLGLGLALERKRSWKSALAEYEKASSIDPRLAEPYRGQGSCLLRLEQPARAEAAFRKATDIDRKFPDAQLGLGEALVRQKKIPDAVAVLTEGIKFGTKTAPQFYMGLGRAEAARDSLRAAEVWLLKAREAAPTNGAIHRTLGDLYMQRKIPQLAINEYNQAKELDPTDLDTRMALGDAYYKGALYNDALNEYKAVVDADPEYLEGYLKLGNLYYLASASDPQRVFSAIEVLEKALTKDPGNVEAKALLAQCYFKKGGTEGRAKSKQLLDEIAASGTMPPSAYRTLGVIQYESREYQNAINSFSKANRLEPIDQFRLADAYRRLGAEPGTPEPNKAAFNDSAFAVYDRIIAVDSTSADGKKARLEHGKLAYQRKDYPAAIVDFTRTIALDPKSAEAYYYMGLSQRQQGNDSTGVQSLQKAVELDPKQTMWWVQLGGARQKLGDEAGATEAFERASQDTTTAGAQGSALALQQLGGKALQAKDYPKAIDLLEESVRRDPKPYFTWVWLAQAHQNAGDKSRAIECYRKVLELKPDEPNAVKGLKALGA